MPKSTQTSVVGNRTGIPTSHTQAHFTYIGRMTAFHISQYPCGAAEHVCDVGMPVLFVVILTTLVWVLFGITIPTSFCNFCNCFLYLYVIKMKQFTYILCKMSFGNEHNCYCTMSWRLFIIKVFPLLWGTTCILYIHCHKICEQKLWQTILCILLLHFLLEFCACTPVLKQLVYIYCCLHHYK